MAHQQQNWLRRQALHEASSCQVYTVYFEYNTFESYRCSSQSRVSMNHVRKDKPEKSILSDICNFLNVNKYEKYSQHLLPSLPGSSMPSRTTVLLWRRRRRLDALVTLAVAEDVLQSLLLSRGDGQAVVALDLDPGLDVGALEAVRGGQVLLGALVALGAVGVLRDGPELGAVEVVGEGLALLGGPVGGAGLGERVSISRLGGRTSRDA